MTGNDMVDLATAAVESNWERIGFLQKQFTWEEQQYIQEAAIPEVMVWRLWSMKESAYKIYNRQYGFRFFAPLKFSCHLFDGTTGAVNIETICYQTISTISKEYVYSVASGMNSAPLLANQCFNITELQKSDQLPFIYQTMIEHYAQLRGIEKINILLMKNEHGAPFLHGKTDNSNVPVSITHHGNYAAFTIN